MIFDLFGLGLIRFEVSATAFSIIMVTWLITFIGGGLYLMRSVEIWRGEE
jgi:hypothetical protein